MDAYVARQPIFDREQRVVSYELLYRQDEDNLAGTLDTPDAATSEVIVNSVMELGLDNIAQGSLAHINVTGDMLVSGHFPTECKHLLAPELPNNTAIDDTLITALAMLKSKGYTIILDDFVFREPWEAVLPFTTAVKLDVQSLSDDATLEQLTILRQFDLTLIAKKVETIAEFERCHHLGFDQFQGYFFAKPEIINNAKMPKNSQVVMKLIDTLNDPNASIETVEHVVSMDARLAVKLLRIVNSALYPYPGEIHSLQRAIVILGHNELRRWVTLLSLTDIDNVHSALLHQAMVRAEMCRTLAPNNEGEYFTAGLFSLLEAMVGIPFETIARESHLPQSLVDAIACHAGPIGEVLSITIAYERGIFHSQRKIAKHSNRAYLHSIQWADSLAKTLSMTP